MRCSRSVFTTASLTFRSSAAPFVRARTAASAVFRAAMSASNTLRAGVGAGNEAFPVRAVATDCANEMMSLTRWDSLRMARARGPVRRLMIETSYPCADRARFLSEFARAHVGIEQRTEPRRELAAEYATDVLMPVEDMSHGKLPSPRELAGGCRERERSACFALHSCRETTAAARAASPRARRGVSGSILGARRLRLHRRRATCRPTRASQEQAARYALLLAGHARGP